MNQDPFADLKQRQREMWSSFAPMAMFTTPVAGQLVKFAQIAPGEKVLDVGTGTGVVAITAAIAGAEVTALDLTPALLAQARDNARIAERDDIVWTEGDVERLPYPDASFDVVLSQFGHMFAPRPDIAVAEMHRVLKRNGRIAWATWPPEHLVGRMFMERTIGPMQKLVETFAAAPERLALLRAEFDAMVRPYHADNVVRQDYLLTRAQGR